MPAVECLLDAKAQLGESPVWSADEGALYWVDIKAPALHRLDPLTRETQTWPMPQPIGCAGLCESGAAIVALRDGFYRFDLVTEKLDCIARPQSQAPNTRFNDGKVSPDGRFWAGTLDDEEFTPVGSLYRLDPDGTVQEIANGFIVANGLAWDAEGTTMYFSDTRAHSIWTYEYDLETGTASNRATFANPDDDIGRPDGGATDVEGCYWSAGPSADVLNRWDRDGNLVNQIKVPFARPTMPCFGGPDMKTIFVTSSREGATPQALAEKPHTGGVFAIDVDVAGVPVGKFKG